MGYSALRIWLHPKLTGKVMEELEGQVADNAALRSQLALLTDELDTARALKAEADLMADEQRRRIGELEGANARLQSELGASRSEESRLRDELADKIEVEEAVRDIESRFKEVKDMKARYEKRIALLRDEVTRLKKASGTHDPEADEIKEIDMLSQEQPVTGLRERHRREADAPRRAVKDDSDWLELL